MSFPSIGEIVTRRLTIRPIIAADLHDLMHINGDDEVTRFLPYATWLSIDDGHAWLKRMDALRETETGQQLVIIRNADNKVIGTTLLFRYDKGSARIELGYVIGRAYWRQGYANESLSAVCGHAFGNMGIRRIEAEIDPENLSSNAALMSLGFVKEGLLRKRWITKGVPTDTNIYACLAEEWHRS